MQEVPTSPDLRTEVLDPTIDWIAKHAELFDPFDRAPGDHRRLKALAELSLVALLLARKNEDRAPELLSLVETHATDPRLATHVLRNPELLPLHATIAAVLVENGRAPHELVHAIDTAIGLGYANAFEAPPGEAVTLAWSLERLAVEPGFAPVETWAAVSMLADPPPALLIGDQEGYNLVHDVFYATDFGRAPLPGSSGALVFASLDTTLGVCIRRGNVDLAAEMLAACGCLHVDPTLHDPAWELILAARHEDGSIMPTATESAEIEERIHPAIATLLAACLAGGRPEPAAEAPPLAIDGGAARAAVARASTWIASLERDPSTVFLALIGLWIARRVGASTNTDDLIRNTIASLERIGERPETDPALLLLARRIAALHKTNIAWLDVHAERVRATLRAHEPSSDTERLELTLASVLVHDEGDPLPATTRGDVRACFGTDPAGTLRADDDEVRRVLARIAAACDYGRSEIPRSHRSFVAALLDALVADALARYELDLAATGMRSMRYAGVAERRSYGEAMNFLLAQQTADGAFSRSRGRLDAGLDDLATTVSVMWLLAEHIDESFRLIRSVR